MSRPPHGFPPSLAGSVHLTHHSLLPWNWSSSPTYRLPLGYFPLCETVRRESVSTLIASEAKLKVSGRTGSREEAARVGIMCQLLTDSRSFLLPGICKTLGGNFRRPLLSVVSLVQVAKLPFFLIDQTLGTKARSAETLSSWSQKMSRKQLLLESSLRLGSVLEFVFVGLQEQGGHGDPPGTCKGLFFRFFQRHD